MQCLKSCKNCKALKGCIICLLSEFLLAFFHYQPYWSKCPSNKKVCFHIRLSKFLRLAHLCPSHSSPISGHFRSLWQTLTLSAESHFPGAAQLCLMNFLGKEGWGYLGGHLMWATFIKLRSWGSGWNWKMEKRVISEGCRQAGAKTKTKEGRGEQNKQIALMQSRMIANGLEIWQVARAWSHVVNRSQLIHHSCLKTLLLQACFKLSISHTHTHIRHKLLSGF